MAERPRPIRKTERMRQRRRAENRFVNRERTANAVRTLNEHREVADLWLRNLDLGDKTTGWLHPLHMRPALMPTLVAAELLRMDESRRTLVNHAELLIASRGSVAVIRDRVKRIDRIRVDMAPFDVGWVFYSKTLPDVEPRILDTSLQPQVVSYVSGASEQNAVHALIWARGKTSTLVEMGGFLVRMEGDMVRPTVEPVPGTYRSLYTATINNDAGLVAGRHRHILSLLAATWEYARIPLAHGVNIETADDEVTRGRSEIERRPDDREVVLRNLRPTQSRESVANGESSSEREYTHQWMVQGHWRNQRVGPGLSERRRVWVSEHSRGPKDADLIDRPRIWRL